ncbi:MAG: hypothetical protein ABL308_10545 [Oceanicaulis sp.]
MRALAAVLIAAALPAAAVSQPGPHTPPSEYESARGAPFGASRTVTFDFFRGPDAGSLTPVGDLSARLGGQWTAWTTPEGETRLVDLAADRMLTVTEDAVVSTSLFAEVRRRLDVYAGLSRGGSLEEIEFGPAGAFHRIWLESAMGVAGPEAGITSEDTATGFSASFDGETVFSASYSAGADSDCQAAPLPPTHQRGALALTRQNAPIHPQILAELEARDGFPCLIEYRIYSPDSPEGRTERWVLTESGDGPGLPPLPDLDALLPEAELLGAAGQTGMLAAAGEAGEAPAAADFFEAAAALRADGDLAGAFLVTMQETHHFGPCPTQTVGSGRPACNEVRALTAEGVGDPDFERVLEGSAALRSGDHARAVELLSAELDREGWAGAAARILVANELIAWGRDGLQSRPDLDPAELLSESLQMDPFAPDAYWHLGRRYLAAGAPHAAFVLFDLGRALPGRQPTELLAQADALEARLAALAPEWVGAAPNQTPE